MKPATTITVSRLVWVEYLRALAVLSVLLFHLELFDFGYLGVELFFIISGFLILPRLSQIGNNSQVTKYWMKRTLRLGLPQIGCFLFVVILAAFLPSEIQRDFGQSLFAAIFRAANIKFWLETDYWAPSSLYKPLLHFWSLALEEQFYAITFIILLALNRLNLSHLFPLILIGLAIFGGLISIFLPEPANFYLIFSRCYLFVAGLYFALGRLKSGIILSISCIAFFALGSIQSSKILEIIPVFIFLAGYAIGSSRFVVKEASLISAIVRYLGSRSYCIYLVHWPVIVAWRVFFGDIKSCELIITVFVLAAAELLYQLFDKHHDHLTLLFNDARSNLQTK